MIDNITKLPKKIVIASHNDGKLKEISNLLSPYNINCLSAKELDLDEPKEIGTTYAENAYIKASYCARETGLPSIADDSGIAIDALDGAPGLFTADWAGKPRNFEKAMERVKQELIMRDCEPQGAKAHFVCSLMFVHPDETKILAEGRVWGSLTFPPRGDKGFGYDSIFIPENYKSTFGEMDMEEKHSIKIIDGKYIGLSHRARAFISLLNKLELKG